MDLGSKLRKRPRRTLVVDKPFQYSVLIVAIVLINAVGAAFVASVFILPSDTFLSRLAPHEVRDLIIRMNAVYYLLSTAVVALLAIVITHRVAGPARVLTRVIEGFRMGIYSRRVRLRKKDYLQSISHSLIGLGEHMKETATKRQSFLYKIDQCLENDEVEKARELLSFEIKGDFIPRRVKMSKEFAVVLDEQPTGIQLRDDDDFGLG